MNADGNEEDCDETEIDDGMNQNGESTCLHITKLNYSSPPRDLTQQPRR